MTLKSSGILFLTTLLLLINLACSENATETKNDFFKATVVGRGMDCGDTFLVEFIEKTDEVALITNSAHSTYYADNLPLEHKQAGKIISIQFRTPTPDEEYPCTTFGPAYPHIIIIAAE